MPNYVSECKSKNLLLLGQVTTYISYYFRKAILEYCKVEGKSNRNNVLMEFVRRIESNSTAIRTLVETSIKKDSNSYLKLPIGLLIRSCLIDSIVGLYLSAVDDRAASDIISDFNQDYVRSMPDRYDVYSDRCAASKLDDILLKHMYGLQIEDNYPNYIDWSSYHRDESSRSGFFKIQSSSRLTIAKAYKFLKEDTRYSSVAKDNRYVGEEHFEQFKEYRAKNILTLVQKLEKDYPQVKDIYSEMCEFVHPNGDGVCGSYSYLDESNHTVFFGPQFSQDSSLFPTFITTLSCSIDLYIMFIVSIKDSIVEFSQLCENSLSSNEL